MPDSPPRPNPPDGRARALLAMIGSMAMGGPVIEWVAATHRRGEGPAGASLSPHVSPGPPDTAR